MYQLCYKHQFDPKRIWLESNFRVFLIKKGIEKARSLNGLGKILGYRSNNAGWSVRKMLVGVQPFTLERLAILTNFVEYPLEKALEHATRKERISIEATKAALKEHGLWCYLLR